MNKWFILQIMLILKFLNCTTYNPVIVKDRNITTAIQIFQSCFER